MRRYVTRPRCGVVRRESSDIWECDDGEARSVTVIEPDQEPLRTGLYDRHGNELYAIDEAQPIGFVHHKG